MAQLLDPTGIYFGGGHHQAEAGAGRIIAQGAPHPDQMVPDQAKTLMQVRWGVTQCTGWFARP